MAPDKRHGRAAARRDLSRVPTRQLESPVTPAGCEHMLSYTVPVTVYCPSGTSPVQVLGPAQDTPSLSHAGSSIRRKKSRTIRACSGELS